MPEKTKYFDRIMSKRGLTKFDKSVLTNDGGKYSPSIRRFRKHYLYDTKTSTSQIPSQRASIAIPNSDSELSIDLMSTPLKCDDCQKHDGLFQCCHCNQRLCIRCCNKHYKRVTVELECLHELRDCLLTKIIHTKTDLERQKTEAIEQCHKWRIDTMNMINKAHTLLIQTIHEEFELLSKEYDFLVEKEMSLINIDKNDLIRMKKGNLSSLLVSPSSTTTAVCPIKSIDGIKQRIETFTKYIDETDKFSFQVKLPTFIIDDTLKVESRFGKITRCIDATGQNQDFINDGTSTKSDEKSKKESSAVFSTENRFHHRLKDSSPTSLNRLSVWHSDRYRMSSFSLPPSNEKTNSEQIDQSEQNEENTENRQRTDTLLSQSSINRPRATSTPTFI